MRELAKAKKSEAAPKKGAAREAGEDVRGVDDSLREAAWLAEIASRFSRSRSADRILRFIASQPERASGMTASALAEAIGVTPATVVRFAQSAGFRGWPDFQTHFRHRYLGSLSPTAVDLALEVRERPAGAALSRDLRNLETLVETVDEAALAGVARAIASGRTLVASSGSYTAVGEILVQNARFLGYDVTLEARGASHLVGAILALEPGDTFIAVSFWRLTNQIVQAARWCREHGIRTVAITDSVFSPLAAEADEVLTAPTESVAFFQSLTGAISLVYALLAELHELDGDRARTTLREAQKLYDALEVLYRSPGTNDKPKES
ncbi:MAG: MurR/RpiR family transcriptional regulator [Actinobacteria bacterium]|nr:MurR/RpiR family transcriptional regulator [Actinomycetota bacterium]